MVSRKKKLKNHIHNKKYRTNKNNHKKNTTYKTKKHKKNYTQKGGGPVLNYAEDLATTIDTRMEFFKNQANQVKFEHLAKTVQRLYQTYKYDVAKGGLTSQGRRLEVPGSSIVDAEAQIPKAQASDVGSPDVTKHSPHTSIFKTIYETAKTDDEFFADNCYISFTSLHGIMTKPNDFKVVPPNTMVCFISGLDYLNVTESSQLYSIKSFLEELNYQRFAYLFKYQMNFIDVIQNNKQLEVSKSSRREGMRYSQYNSYLYSSCFHNSMWYYPGQVYPNLVNSTTKDDTSPRGYSFYYFDHMKQKMPYRISDPTFPDHYGLKTQYFNQANNTRFERDLSELVDYQKSDLHKNIKLVLAIACRPIFGQKKKDYFQLEVFTYHLNKEMLAKIQSDIATTDKIEAFPRCSQESGKEFYFRVEDYRYEFDNLADRNDNYNHMVPDLIEIMANVESGKIETRDLRVLSTLSFTKLYKFILQIPEVASQPDIKYNLIIKLVRENYDMLSRNFIDYINVFHYSPYLQIQPEYFHSSTEKIQYMEALNNLFSNTLNKAGLHSFQFSERFLDFYQSYNHTQNILNQKFPPKQLGKFQNIQYNEVVQISTIKGQSIEILCRSEKFHLDKPTHSITSLKLNYVSQLIFDAGPDSTKINFNQVFQFLPGLNNLELFGIKATIKLEPTDDCLSLVSFKAIQCEIEIEKFDKFPNLRKIQIENCGNIEELHLDDNPHLQEVVLSDLNKLACLYIGEPGQRIHTIRISNCFGFMRSEAIWIQGIVQNFILQDSKFINVLSELIKRFDVENVEIINCTIPVSILTKLCQKTRGILSNFKYTPRLKLHFTTITGDYLPSTSQELPTIKNNLLSLLKKIKNLDIYQPYYEINSSSPSNMVPFNDFQFDGEDIKKLNLNHKKNLTISANTLIGTIRAQDLTHITILP